ncbi:hypothetical protein [Streptomyces sp. IBSBF 2435]|uniref:hypothetical protein n=1 Tax=Streptomyces sp. IBSBF 2435 TaxID=2903531 RepID=UPI002FDC7649
MTSQTTTEPIRYAAWADVPANTFMTKTQLADLDLPRKPGSVAAVVDGYDYRDKKTTIELYRISESAPSPASARTLTAARARTGGPDPRRCTDCDARPELSCRAYQDGARRCQTCAHIHRLRVLQRGAADVRAHATQRAAELLADERLAVVHVDLTDRGTTPSGTRRSPSAARLTALDHTGKLLIETQVRLVRPRSDGIPAGAIAPADAALPLRAALADRKVLRWGWDALGPLTAALRTAGWSDVIPHGYGSTYDLHQLTAQWRGDLDPRTTQTRPVIEPGRADRMLYLLQQIAATAPTSQAGGTPIAGNE